CPSQTARKPLLYGLIAGYNVRSVFAGGLVGVNALFCERLGAARLVRAEADFLLRFGLRFWAMGELSVRARLFVDHPAERPAADEMDVQVIHLLPAMLVAVDDEPV